MGNTHANLNVVAFTPTVKAIRSRKGHVSVTPNARRRARIAKAPNAGA